MRGVSGRCEDFAPGGCKICINGSWLAMMLAFDLVPPTCQHHKGRWMRIWRERHEREGIRNFDKRFRERRYEKEGRSIPTEQVKAPTFAIGG
ncbi:hypothetical protein ACVIIV_003180 [Bradyrhizobium sp. USDA 4354]